ncbi:MAG TPA: NYN domain-containing protein [Marinobacter sp.]|nr:NYN domain-containing protein [Marinobacter sp.]
MSDHENDKLAVLIDADNAQAAICQELLAEISKFGIASVKRAYGDWTTTNLKGWKSHLHKHAIQPIQQFSYTQGKNSTDSSLIIDAMDLLHEARLDGFCLISSDSDFTRLANRIRESGLVVYGFGEKKTPEPFVAACDKFVYTEVLRASEGGDTKDESSNPELKAIIIDAVNAVSRDDGWSPLSAVGSYINKNTPSFDPRNYGYDKLGQLVRSLSYLEIQERSFSAESSNVHIYVREKSA